LVKRKHTATANEPPIAFGPLNESIGYLVRRAQLRIYQRFFERFADVDIRPVQYSVLTLIECNPGLGQTRLADALGIKKANLVALIDELEARGLALRKPATSDRRARELYLTPKGMALAGRLHRMDSDLGRKASGAMSAARRRRLCEVLRRLAT
jgi:DNA-binding MarR family transcriptional regulator